MSIEYNGVVLSKPMSSLGLKGMCIMSKSRAMMRQLLNRTMLRVRNEQTRSILRKVKIKLITQLITLSFYFALCFLLKLKLSMAKYFYNDDIYLEIDVLKQPELVLV